MNRVETYVILSLIFASSKEVWVVYELPGGTKLIGKEKEYIR